ncbi:MAG: hypothetical protein JXA03_07890 [Bacteroidales bacterium]|nr:hypothetical protein [Bacteroidales bacterium]
MKKCIIVSILILLSAGFLRAQGLEDILKSYFETTGQEVFNKINSMVMKGVTIAQGLESDIVIMQKRPDKMRLELDIQGMKMVQGYDGQKGWIIAPWSGSSDPVELTGFDLASLKSQADFEGPLYNWEAKGHKAELSDNEEIQGTEVFVIRLVLNNGDINTYYIDTENNLLIKMASKSKDGESEVVMETIFGNYKPLNGMLVPFSLETRMGGQMVSQVTIHSLEFDQEMDDSIFAKPKPEEK